MMKSFVLVHHRCNDDLILRTRSGILGTWLDLAWCMLRNVWWCVAPVCLFLWYIRWGRGCRECVLLNEWGVSEESKEKRRGTGAGARAGTRAGAGAGQRWIGFFLSLYTCSNAHDTFRYTQSRFGPWITRITYPNQQTATEEGPIWCWQCLGEHRHLAPSKCCLHLLDSTWNTVGGTLSCFWTTSDDLIPCACKLYSSPAAEFKDCQKYGINTVLDTHHGLLKQLHILALHPWCELPDCHQRIKRMVHSFILCS